MTNNKAIAYPFAYDVNKDPVSIDSARHGAAYLCVGCNNPMIPKMGIKMIHHFAHKANESCNPDNALHESAKIHIVRKFNKFIQASNGYTIMVPCSKCRCPIKYDLTAGSARIVQEESVIDKTRSDLTVLKNNSTPHTIIEIVVTHDLESYVHDAYLKSKIPIIKIKPSWDKLDGAVSTMNITCEKCIIRKVDTKYFMSDISKSDQRLREITHDKYGSQLFPKIQSLVNRHACMLADFGFVQQSKRPTLFMYESIHWRVYVDLDSTDVMKIWEVDCVPGLYAYPKNEEKKCHPDCRECVLERTCEKLSDACIQTRRYFNDHGFHWHEYSSSEHSQNQKSSLTATAQGNAKRLKQKKQKLLPSGKVHVLQNSMDDYAV